MIISLERFAFSTV